jgi:hypothetical protein
MPTVQGWTSSRPSKALCDAAVENESSSQTPNIPENKAM